MALPTIPSARLNLPLSQVISAMMSGKSKDRKHRGRHAVESLCDDDKIRIRSERKEKGHGRVALQNTAAATAGAPRFWPCGQLKGETPATMSCGTIMQAATHTIAVVPVRLVKIPLTRGNIAALAR